MGLGEKILSKIGYNRRNPIRWMTWFGDKCSPGFTIRLEEMSGVRAAYCRCSPVSTIINRLASSMANGKWWILDENNNDVSKKYEAISKLMRKPNPLQTRTDFVKQINIYKYLYGVTYAYAVVPAGYKSVSDAVALWPVNPERIEPVFRKDTPYFAQKIEDIIEKYVITIDNTRIDADPKHILEIRDSFGYVQDYDKYSNLSRLSSLEYEVRNIIQAQEAVYALNKDRGAMGILTNKTKDVSGNIPMSPEEKKQVQDDYHRIHGLDEKRAKVLITDSDLAWQQMSFNVKDLMLFEGMKQNIESICDALNYPFELLANQKGTTFANRSEAIKYLYQDNVIPSANIDAEKFTEFFELQNAVFNIDFSDVEYLKEAEKEKAGARLSRSRSLEIDYKLGIITREEYRAMQDMDEKPKGVTFYTAEDGKENTGQS